MGVLVRYKHYRTRRRIKKNKHKIDAYKIISLANAVPLGKIDGTIELPENIDMVSKEVVDSVGLLMCLDLFYITAMNDNSVLDFITRTCPSVNIFPETNTITLSQNDLRRLSKTAEQEIQKFANKEQILQYEALKRIIDFSKTNKLLI